MVGKTRRELEVIGVVKGFVSAVFPRVGLLYQVALGAAYAYAGLYMPARDSFE